jgi:quercetin 2,3-dioxygenase
MGEESPSLMDLEIDRIDRAEPRAARSPAHQARVVFAPDDFRDTSPFLFMAEDWFAPPAGFPEHPHRGMQTVTVVLDGSLEHRDHTGGHGMLEAGDVQWMTAGRGVLHSEMPGHATGVHTLQLWLNLPAAEKMAAAAYRDQRLADTPVARGEGYEVRVYAGRLRGVEHPHGSLWPMTLLDMRVQAGAHAQIEVPTGQRAFLYVVEGAAQIDGRRAPVRAEDVAWFKPGLPGGGAATLSIASKADFRALLFAGPVIDEPVVAHGPFVMNTLEEIRQAYADYRAGRLTG